MARSGSHPGVAVTSGLRVGMDLLRLTPVELVARLHGEAKSNPFLIVRDRPSESVAPVTKSLGEDLRAQLSEMTLPARVHRLAEYLTELLDPRGFLPQTRAEIAVETRLNLGVVEAAIAALTSCDPAGIGARNVQQCLALQLERQGMTPTRAHRVVAAYEPLMTGDLAGAHARLGGSDAELRALAKRLGRLTTDPAQPVATEATRAPTPDLIVTRHGDGALSVEATDHWMPMLAIDRILRLQGQEHAPSRDFVEGRVRDAENVIRGVEFRRQTLVRLGRYLTEAQADIFSGQSVCPRPLTRTEAAAALDLHPSTVGRALRGRSLMFEGQSLRLDGFFPRRVDASGEHISPEVVMRMVRQMVSEEPRERPHSDTALAEKLNDAGVDIARRTVAKYRDAMNIPPSRIRRRLGLGSRRGQV